MDPQRTVPFCKVKAEGLHRAPVIEQEKLGRIAKPAELRGGQALGSRLPRPSTSPGPDFDHDELPPPKIFQYEIKFPAFDPVIARQEPRASTTVILKSGLLGGVTQLLAWLHQEQAPYKSRALIGAKLLRWKSRTPSSAIALRWAAVP